MKSVVCAAARASWTGRWRNGASLRSLDALQCNGATGEPVELKLERYLTTASNSLENLNKFHHFASRALAAPGLSLSLAKSAGLANWITEQAGNCLL